MKLTERGPKNADVIKSASASNLNYIMKRREINQERLAEELGISVQLLNEYLEGQKLPDTETLINIKNLYHISIDEFLTSEIQYSKQIRKYNDKKDEADIKMLRRFCGVYHMHYFDTTVYKYTNITDKLRPRISNGILQIYEEKTPLGNSCFKAAAITCCTRSECNNFFVQMTADSSLETLHDLDLSNIKHHHFYTGELDATSHNFFVSLSSTFRDKCLMIFQNPDSDKKYFGGIGTVNSVSRGHESMPCAQFMMITRNPITCDDNEIAELLHLGYKKMTFSDEDNMLVNRLKKIMASSGNSLVNGASLSDDETDVLICHNIEKLVNRLLRHQYFKCATISIQDDYNWYKTMEKYLDKTFDDAR